MRTRIPRLTVLLLGLAVAVAIPTVGMAGGDVSPLDGDTRDTNSPKDPPRYIWHSFTKNDGLPSNKIFALRVDGDRLWIGTDEGLVLREDGTFKTFTVDDGLSHRAVLALDVDPLSGDVWAGTMGGLSRLSGGVFETFNQFNSGLANDVIYSVAVDGHHVWIATAAGASRFNTRTNQWDIYNEKNAPMHEPWTYSVTASDEKIYIAAWGGGLLEFDKATEHWKDYLDPDGEMELDVFRDDGPVHDITSSVSYADGVVWVATYFGLSRFDRTRWRGYLDSDSGLVSNFINFVRANGPDAWVCTDKGLSRFDGETWTTFRRLENGQGEVQTTNDEASTTSRNRTAIAHNFVLSVDFDGDRIWVGTEDGLSVGVPEGSGDDLSSYSK
jgi:ligand-binding sensor domain-containing protein